MWISKWHAHTTTHTQKTRHRACLGKCLANGFVVDTYRIRIFWKDTLRRPTLYMVGCMNANYPRVERLESMHECALVDKVLNYNGLPGVARWRIKCVNVKISVCERNWSRCVCSGMCSLLGCGAGCVCVCKMVCEWIIYNLIKCVKELAWVQNYTHIHKHTFVVRPTGHY